MSAPHPQTTSTMKAASPGPSLWVDTPSLHYLSVLMAKGFSGGSDGKASAYSAGDPGSVPGSGISPGDGNGNPLQYSCLEKPMDRGAWRATAHGVAESDTTERLTHALRAHNVPDAGPVLSLRHLIPSSQ